MGVVRKLSVDFITKSSQQRLLCDVMHETRGFILRLLSIVHIRFSVQRLHPLLLLSTCATIYLSIAVAQVSPTTASARDPHVVTVTFFVNDNRGNPVNSLRLSDLSVLDNGKPPLRVVSLGTATKLPLRLGILIDNNPGLGVNYSKEQLQYEAAPRWAFDFVKGMLTESDDMAFIASYSTIRHGTTFVNRDQVQPIDLNQFLKTDEPNFLGARDAIRIACGEVFGPDTAGPQRRILIVVPGFDQTGRSLSDYAQTISAAQRAGVKVFVSGWYGSPLQVIVSETGGYYFGGRLIEQRSKSQIDAMYVLSYVPSEPYRRGELRRLDLKTTDKSWHVRAPKRYLFLPAQ
jgi:hypothetical protein